MNLALSDEQLFLREAARGTLSRYATLADARHALDGGQATDLWPAACEAGWPGLLVSEEDGGAGLDAFDAMLVMGECGRALAAVALLGHLPATGMLSAAASSVRTAAGLAELATGEQRAAYLPVRPPDDLTAAWTVDAVTGMERGPAPRVESARDELAVSGRLSWVPDAAGAHVLVGVAVDSEGRGVGVAVNTDDERVRTESVHRYDATRALAHVFLDGAPAIALDLDADELSAAWYLAQALIAAESVGSVETALATTVAYAKERHTFGRAIGSYQAVKHGITEMLRLLENARSLLYYAGWARRGAPHEFPLAASAARVAAGRALDFGAREMIAVHGGIGATWEHDAPLYFRRSQLSRRLLGGSADAADRVAAHLLAAA